jgi:deoxyinosine 3'endonuclease (endonuclease V)
MSYAQKRKNLDRLTDNYILGSDGNIRVVVGLDIEYKTSKKATLSVWRPNIIINKAGEKELIAQLIVANQVCIYYLYLRLILT